jgi:hypothetical protein
VLISVAAIAGFLGYFFASFAVVAANVTCKHQFKFKFFITLSYTLISITDINNTSDRYYKHHITNITNARILHIIRTVYKITTTNTIHHFLT